MSGATYAASVAGVALGLAVMLVSEYAHLGDLLVYGSGAVVLAFVGLMTVAIAREDHPPDHDGEHGH